MPPRRGARAVATEAATSALAPLPLQVVHRIMSLVPVDSRARACCVCRGWRDVLAELSLWTELDLSGVCGVSCKLNATAVLLGASRRAQGQLISLKLGEALAYTREVLEVVAANSGSLRELHMPYLCARNQELPHDLEVRNVLQAAPQLELLDVRYMSCAWEVAPRMLHAEGALKPLRVRWLGTLCLHPHTLVGINIAAPFAAALADAAAQPALRELTISGADLQQSAVMTLLVDAVLVRPRLSKLTIGTSCTPPAPAPLARLLRDGTLKCLNYHGSPGNRTPLFDAAGAVVVAEALRANTTLTEITMWSAGLLCDMAAADTFLRALAGHHSLTTLVLGTERFANPVVLGAAVAALVAADAPALRKLRLVDVGLRQCALAPLVDALAANHHLRELDLCSNDVTRAFVEEQLLPAVARAGAQRAFAITGL